MKNDMSSIKSIGIRKYLGNDAVEVATAGEGDNKLTLWRSADGKREAIETNGDPILDAEDAFSEAKEMLA